MTCNATAMKAVCGAPIKGMEMKEKPKAPLAGFNTRTTKIVSALAGKPKQQQTAA